MKLLVKTLLKSIALKFALSLFEYMLNTSLKYPTTMLNCQVTNGTVCDPQKSIGLNGQHC